MKRFFFLALLVLCVGCVGPNQWYRPDTISAGGYTYDNGHQSWGQVGVSGELGNKKDGVRMDIYGLINHDYGQNQFGVGLNFDIPIGGAK